MWTLVGVIPHLIVYYVSSLSSSPQSIKGERYRLHLVVSELDKATAIEYQIALLAFVNCVIISAGSLKDRIRMRNEFIGKCVFCGRRAQRNPYVKSAFDRVW